MKPSPKACSNRAPKVTTAKHRPSIPAHEQVAEFRVGAILATQAMAVYIDAEGTSGARREASNFSDLPERLKIRVLAACEESRDFLTPPNPW
jgi:hypothetical protein